MNDPTESEIDTMFAEMTAALEASMPPVPDHLTDPENMRKLTGMAHRAALREVASLRGQLQETEQDRDQLRQGLADLDEQLHWVIAERDELRTRLEDRPIAQVFERVHHLLDYRRSRRNSRRNRKAGS